MVADEQMLVGIGIVAPLWPPGQMLMANVISFTSRTRFLFPVDTDTDPDSDPEPDDCLVSG
jgi:hypothetical protein